MLICLAALSSFKEERSPNSRICLSLTAFSSTTLSSSTRVIPHRMQIHWIYDCYLNVMVGMFAGSQWQGHGFGSFIGGGCREMGITGSMVYALEMAMDTLESKQGCWLRMCQTPSIQVGFKQVCQAIISSQLDVNQMLTSQYLQIIPLIRQYVKIVSMKAAIPVLNILLSIAYISLGIVATYFLKRSLQPAEHTTQKRTSPASSQQPHQVPYPKLFLLSFLKKYTLPGSALQQEKKYLLKELLILSIYGAACLKINHIVLWPCAFAVPSIIVIAILFEYVAKLSHKGTVEDYRKNANSQYNANRPKIQSELEIESVNVEVIVHTINANSQHNSESNKSNANSTKTTSQPRPMLQQLILSGMTLLCCVLLSHIVLTLSKSISNSGQLNIQSVCIIFLIDQIGIRLILGGVSVGILFAIDNLTQIQISQWQIAANFIEDELAVWSKRQQEIKAQKQRIKIQEQQLRRKEQIENEHQESDAQTKGKGELQIQPQPLLFVSPIKNNLNLINLLQQQLTKREHQEDEDIDNIYLTTAEKQIFSNDGDLELCGPQTKRRKLKDGDASHLSAMTLGVHGLNTNKDDLVLVKNPILGELQINLQGTYGNLLLSPGGQTKRKRGLQYKKKNKRNLHLTGSSPYLQYLPDMLKKVEKGRKDQASKKVL